MFKNLFLLIFFLNNIQFSMASDRDGNRNLSLDKTAFLFPRWHTVQFEQRGFVAAFCSKTLRISSLRFCSVEPQFCSPALLYLREFAQVNVFFIYFTQVSQHFLAEILHFVGINSATSITSSCLVGGFGLGTPEKTIFHFSVLLSPQIKITLLQKNIIPCS